MGIRIVWPQLKRASNPLDGEVVISKLRREKAQKVPGTGMIRIDGNDFTIGPFGIYKPPLPVMFKCPREDSNCIGHENIVIRCRSIEAAPARGAKAGTRPRLCFCPNLGRACLLPSVLFGARRLRFGRGASASQLTCIPSPLP